MGSRFILASAPLPGQELGRSEECGVAVRLVTTERGNAWAFRQQGRGLGGVENLEPALPSVRKSRPQPRGHKLSPTASVTPSRISQSSLFPKSRICCGLSPRACQTQCIVSGPTAAASAGNHALQPVSRRGRRLGRSQPSGPRKHCERIGGWRKGPSYVSLTPV